MNDRYTISNIISLLDEFDFEKMMKDLINDLYWTNYAEFIGFNYCSPMNKKQKAITSVNMSLIDEFEDEPQCYTLDLQEFRQVLVKVTANNIIKNREKEMEYKSLFVELMKRINNPNKKK